MYGPWVYPWKQGDEHCYVDHPFEYLGLAYGLPVVEQQVVGDVEYEYTLHHAQEGAQVQGLCRLEVKASEYYQCGNAEYRHYHCNYAERSRYQPDIGYEMLYKAHMAGAIEP